MPEARDEAPFLAQDPPPAVARGLSSLLIALFTVASIAAAAVSVPETVSAPFVLVPVRGTDPVRAPRKGSVTQALVTLGRPVARGALLFEISSPEVSDRFSESETLDSTVQGSVQGLVNLRARNDSQARAAGEEARGLAERAASLLRAVAFKKEQLQLVDEQLQRFRTLTDQGLTSMNERSNAEIRRSQTILEMETLEAERLAAQSALQKLRDTEAARASSFREEERALIEKVEHARIRGSALRRETHGGRGADFSVTAPCDGTVTAVKVRAAGAVVLEGDVLAEVACRGETLQAQLEAPEAGLSRIRAGQPVRLLLDAFPYQRYGTRPGTVRWASPAGVSDAPTATFAVLVDLDEQAIAAEGVSSPLVAGMRGTARVGVGRRTLIQYAFEPLRTLRENLR